MREEIQENVSVRFQDTGRAVRNRALLVVSIIVLAVAGISIYMVKAYLPTVGILLLWAFGFFVVLGMLTALVAFVKWLGRGRFIAIDAHGGYLENWLGKLTPLAPLNAANTTTDKKSGKPKVVEALPAVPSILDLIESGDIAQGKLEMVMGYDKAQFLKGILELVTGDWPGTHAVAGKGRSGKTRRVILEIVQAIIAGALVTVCDPHYNKPDSLARALEPLEQGLERFGTWLRIARGEAQIVAATHEFFNEMEKRVSNDSDERIDGGQYRPRFIVYDEWARLMTHDKVEEEDKDLMKKTAEGCSKEYAGYNGFCCLIGQAWTQEQCGGTTIRRLLQVVFCHNISAEFAAFFFRKKRDQDRAETLKRRECLYKDYEGTIREIITPTIPDDTATRVAELLLRIASAPQRKQLSAPEEMPAQPAQDLKQRRYNFREYEFPALPEGPAPLQHTQGNHREVQTDEVYPMPAAGARQAPEFYNAQTTPFRQTEPTQPPADNVLHMPRRQPPEQIGHPMGGTQNAHPTEAVESDKIEVSFAEERAILQAIFDLQKQLGRVPFRTEIRDHLGWNNKQYPKIQVVCDRYRIAMPNGGRSA